MSDQDVLGKGIQTFRKISSRMPELSARQREVLQWVAVGRSNTDIAQALRISPRTVKSHVAMLMNRLGAASRLELAVIAVIGRLDCRTTVPVDDADRAGRVAR